MYLLEPARDQRKSNRCLKLLLGWKLLPATKTNSPDLLGLYAPALGALEEEQGVSLAPSFCDRNSYPQSWISPHGSFVLRATQAPSGRGGMEIVKRSPSWVCLQPNSQPGSLGTADFRKDFSDLSTEACPHHPMEGVLWRVPSWSPGQSRSAESWALPGLQPPALLMCCLAMDMNNSSGEGSTEKCKLEASRLLPPRAQGLLLFA